MSGPLGTESKRLDRRRAVPSILTGAYIVLQTGGRALDELATELLARLGWIG